jgi:hypothetical protein
MYFTYLVEVFPNVECGVARLVEYSRPSLRLNMLLPVRTTAATTHWVVECEMIVLVLPTKYWCPTWTTYWGSDELWEIDHFLSTMNMVRTYGTGHEGAQNTAYQPTHGDVNPVASQGVKQF